MENLSEQILTRHFDPKCNAVSLNIIRMVNVINIVFITRKGQINVTRTSFDQNINIKQATFMMNFILAALTEEPR